jgi:DNA modification methylase
MAFEIKHGDCLEVMRGMADNSVDAIVTDPPYGLSFMGKKWDYDVPTTELWAECLRVLKPGGHLLAFAGTRTQHRMAVRIEDAGFEIRDMIAWVYGSGFPKSLDVSKAMDKAAGRTARDVVALKGELRRVFEDSGMTILDLNKRCGFEASGYLRTSSTWASVLPSQDKWWKMREVIGCDDRLSFAFKETEREVIGFQKRGNAVSTSFMSGGNNITAPATPEAQQWQGWGTALKPSHEPLTFARKPLDLRAHCIYLAQYLTSQLCQYSASVKDAGPSSMSSPSASGAAMSGSALWTAVGRCNTPGDLFALMDTLPSGSVLPSTLSTVFSWLRTLDGLLQHESTFTTETASSLTTDLKTLNSLLLRSTQGITIAELTEPSGHGSSAELVACIFNGFDASLRSTLARFAHGNAIAKAQEHYLDAGVSPALEPIVLARKPLDGTVAQTVQRWGTGAINVDGCRVTTDDNLNGGAYSKERAVDVSSFGLGATGAEYVQPAGRWPANLIHDGSEEVLAGFPVTVASKAGGKSGTNANPMDWEQENPDRPRGGHNDNGGSAARFFKTCEHDEAASASRLVYCAKASKADRGESNGHPTVKPTELMRYLVRLVTQPGGTVLDPFTGSGSTGKAAVLEGFEFIGIEREAEYVAIAEARIVEAQRSLGLFA